MCKNNVDGSEWICIQMCSNYVSWIWVKCFDLWCRENMTLYIFMPNVIIMRKILQCRTLIIVCAYANLLILWFVWPTLNVYALSYTCIYMCVCVCVCVCVSQCLHPRIRTHIPDTLTLANLFCQVPLTHFQKHKTNLVFMLVIMDIYRKTISNGSPCIEY